MAVVMQFGVRENEARKKAAIRRRRRSQTEAVTGAQKGTHNKL